MNDEQGREIFTSQPLQKLLQARYGKEMPNCNAGRQSSFEINVLELAAL
jgi:hypothetical protein